MELIKRSPYHHKFAALGAEFVDRIGFAAPLVFTTTQEEHLATRNAVGLFDVCYQVAIEVAGRDAEALLQRTLVADMSRLNAGRVVYASLCNETGGMIDDLTCFRLAEDRFWLFPTPSRVVAVLDTLAVRAVALNATVTNLGYKNAYLSVQGPHSRELLGRLADGDLSTQALPYFAFTRMGVAGVPDVVVSRTGYSGELGYELFYPVEYAEHLWSRVFEAGADLGVKPCGLGALRTLRLEKKYVLYGLDVNDTTTPIEAGLSWTVKLQKPDFVGKAALERQKREGVQRQLVLIEFDNLDFVPPAGASITADASEIGKVTSADRGYSVGRSLALGFVAPAFAKPGQMVKVQSAQGPRSGTINLKPVYDPDGRRVRS
jgi:aminomethyltransferase